MSDPKTRFHFPHFNRYRPADRSPRVAWNDYDYRPDGGKRYRIGVCAVFGGWAWGITWAKPGRDYGARRR